MRKALVFVLVVLGLLSLPVSAKSVSCEWTSPSGERYDFSRLNKKDGYQVQDTSSTMGTFDLIYITNVCETVTCLGVEVSVYEGLKFKGEMLANCDILTKNSAITYSYINNDNPETGVSWSYTGDQCILPPTVSLDDQNQLVTTPNPSTDVRTSTFNLYCSDEQSSNWVVDSSDSCHLKFRMSSPYGCIGAANAPIIQ